MSAANVKRAFFSSIGAVFLATVCASGAYSAETHKLTIIEKTSAHFGPASTYKTAFELPRGARVAVEFCHVSFSWCKIVWGADKGWVRGRYLGDPQSYPTDQSIAQFGPRLGIETKENLGPRLGRIRRSRVDRSWDRQRLQDRLDRLQWEREFRSYVTRERELYERYVRQERGRVERKLREERARQHREHLLELRLRQNRALQNRK